MVTLGHRARIARGSLSQAELARRIGVPAVTVWRWENDRMTPQGLHLEALAKGLGVSLDWLVSGVGHGPNLPPESAAGEVRS